MNVLSVENLEKTVNDTPLFSHVSFGLEEGEHVGLIGHNGAGKSTFLNILAGKTSSDEGLVSLRRGSDVVMLNQTITFDKDETIASYLFKGEGSRIALRREYQGLSSQPSNDKVHRQLMVLDEQLENSGSWNLESDYNAFLDQLGLIDMLDTPMDTLSGGQLKKVGIARILAARPSLLLLDEPTNHLDIETIQWLENYLRKSTMTIIIVTHDRYFLDALCTSILELDNGNIFFHPGSFSSYLERREERMDMLEKEQVRLKGILRRELQWLKRGPKARAGKDSSRKDRIETMVQMQHEVKAEKQRSFTSTERRLGKKILELKDISKSYGELLLFKDFSYNFIAGEKIGIVGPNGSGKSTLLDIVCSHQKSDSGVVDVGINTVFGYYDQNSKNLPQDKTILQYVDGITERIRLSKDEMVTSGRFLQLFGFPDKMQRQMISSLSGGEKRRLYLVSRLLGNPNFLLFDEPTNDLDLETMENLEQYVEDFNGCALIVSHDRAFLDQTCDHLFIIDTEKKLISLYPACFSEYYQNKCEQEKEEKPKPEKPEPMKGKIPQQRKKGLAYREQREYEAITKELEEFSKIQKELEESFSTGEPTALGTLAERNKKYEDNKKVIAKKEERWFSFAEKAES
ncbi:MAG: ABC-F family ATP-binding cassette domain-containing protein [Sphaerochaetaceae bacterium]